MFDVRWLAAEGLIHIGVDAIVPLLHALIERPESVWLREGAHHVLHDLASSDLRAVLMPVLKALEDVDATVVVPLAAETCLEEMPRLKS